MAAPVAATPANRPGSTRLAPNRIKSVTCTDVLARTLATTP